MPTYAPVEVFVLPAAVGQEGLDSERRNGPLAHASACVVGEGQCDHFEPHSGVTGSHYSPWPGSGGEPGPEYSDVGRWVLLDL